MTIFGQRSAGQRWATSSAQVERTIRFPRGLVEITHFNWEQDNAETERRRPNMYIFELPLSMAGAAERGARPGQASRDARIGRALLIPPSCQLRKDIALGPNRSLLCLIDAAWIDSFLPAKPRCDQESTWKLPLGGQVKFERILRGIYNEARQESFGRAMMIESFGNALAVELVRHLKTACADEASRRKGGLAPWRMRLVQERVFGDVSMPHLSELADLCGMTVRHLCRAFKVETGLSPGADVEAAMVQHAQEMLAETALPLGEIALRLGFATSSSFANAFQRATGLKPREMERPIKLAAA